MNDGEFELDKSYFGAKRVRGKRVRGRSHVNGIESFWSFTKRRLAQFNGLRNQMFYFHLKESEFRFNNRHNDIYGYTPY